MNIRKMTKEDTERVLELFKAEWGNEPYFEKWSDEAATKRLREYEENHETFVIEENGIIQGYMILTDYEWHTGPRGQIQELIVTKESQGKGYGGALLKFAHEHFEKQGKYDVGLTTSPKSKAYEIYKKSGYEDEGFVTMKKKL